MIINSFSFLPCHLLSSSFFRSFLLSSSFFSYVSSNPKCCASLRSCQPDHKIISFLFLWLFLTHKHPKRMCERETPTDWHGRHKEDKAAHAFPDYISTNNSISFVRLNNLLSDLPPPPPSLPPPSSLLSSPP